jgi:hypothetical protein
MSRLEWSTPPPPDLFELSKGLVIGHGGSSGVAGSEKDLADFILSEAELKRDREARSSG